MENEKDPILSEDFFEMSESDNEMIAEMMNRMKPESEVKKTSRNKVKKTNITRRTVSIPQDLWQKIRICSIKKNMTVSALICSVLQEHLK